MAKTCGSSLPSSVLKATPKMLAPWFSFTWVLRGNHLWVQYQLSAQLLDILTRICRLRGSLASIWCSGDRGACCACWMTGTCCARWCCWWCSWPTHPAAGTWPKRSINSRFAQPFVIRYSRRMIPPTPRARCRFSLYHCSFRTRGTFARLNETQIRPRLQ